MSDEFDRIARLRKRFQRVISPHVLVGIGDDAAVLAASTDNTVLSVDSAVEHVHFERSFASLQQIAERAFSAAISDLAAMGAQPSSALTSLVLPVQLTAAELDELIEGLARASESYLCPIVGGNLSAGGELSITTTVVGHVSGCGLLRSGARAGDRIGVTGSLGSATLGLRLLQRETTERGEAFVQRWRAPRARIAEGQQLLGLATSAIDVSDGALQDLSHLCEASALGAELFASALPFDPGFAALARAIGEDPLALALYGGEDYELIYTIPHDAAGTGPGTIIGRMTDQPGKLLVRSEDGRALALQGSGYRHFQG